MKVLFFDPQSGASGDMIMGCLLDLGADPNEIIAAVESVNCRLEISRTKKHGIAATKAHVIADGRYHSVEEAKSMLKDACLEPPARKMALSTLATLADAEAEVHGTSSDQVHFHEIGALDALADIAGCCAAFHSLEVEKTFTLPISVGSGTVSTMHGLLPVPAPATLAVLQSSNLLWKGGPIKQELLTPTGAALLANLVDEVIEEYPMIKTERVGYGSGSKDSEMPNVLRGVIGDQKLSLHQHQDQIVQLETNVDDVTGEVLGYLIDLLMKEGALDVSIVPALMKKGRYGCIVKAISKKGDMDRLVSVLMRETGSLGIRVFPSLHRQIAERYIKTLPVYIDGRKHEIRFKASRWKGKTLNVKPEYEDCRKIALERGLSLREVVRKAEMLGWGVIDDK